jgi:hypothetical protein
MPQTKTFLIETKTLTRCTTYQHQIVEEKHGNWESYDSHQGDKGIRTTFDFGVEVVVTSKDDANNPHKDPQSSQHKASCAKWKLEAAVVECW